MVQQCSVFGSWDQRIGGHQFSSSFTSQKRKEKVYLLFQQAVSLSCNPHSCLVVSLCIKKRKRIPTCSLALPAEEQRRDECDDSHRSVCLAASVPSRAVIVVQQRPVAVVLSAVFGRQAARRALHQGHLVGGGPLLRPVRAGAVAGALAVVEQVAAVGVLLHAEKLVLSVGEPDAQCHAAVGHGDVLLHPDLPGPLHSTLVTVEDVEEGGGGQVHGSYSHVVHWTRRDRRLVNTLLVVTIWVLFLLFFPPFFLLIIKYGSYQDNFGLGKRIRQSVIK